METSEVKFKRVMMNYPPSQQMWPDSMKRLIRAFVYLAGGLMIGVPTSLSAMSKAGVDLGLLMSLVLLVIWGSFLLLEWGLGVIIWQVAKAVREGVSSYATLHDTPDENWSNTSSVTQDLSGFRLLFEARQVPSNMHLTLDGLKDFLMEIIKQTVQLRAEAPNSSLILLMKGDGKGGFDYMVRLATPEDVKRVDEGRNQKSE